MLGNGTICGQKSLGMPRGFKPLHTIFALARGAMRVFAPVIEVATLAMLHPEQDLPHSTELRGKAPTTLRDPLAIGQSYPHLGSAATPTI